MSHHQKKDRVFLNKNHGPRPFQFDASVAEAFDDMATRSIPGYNESLHTALWIVETHVRERFQHGVIVDLGSSTGAFEERILSLHDAASWSVVAVDSSSEMIGWAQERCRRAGDASSITWRCEQVQHTHIETCVMIVSHYCLQFVPPDERVLVYQKMYDALQPGGFLVLSEKVRPSTSETPYFQDRYDAFKRAAGYTDEEIVNKRQALEGFLIPWSIQENESMLRRCGFSEPMLMHKNWHFCTWMTQKPT